MKERIKKETEKIADWVIDIRRDIHAHPELGLQEERTSKKVAEHLQELGLDVKTGLGVTGVVGLLEGSASGRTIAIRADMDALPITEETGLPFASQNQGIMHACGHDGHVAMALGAARVLTEMRNEIKGSVKFIFQPAEENYGGARGVIDDGALDNPKVDSIISLHVDIDEDVGRLSIMPGATSASADVFVVSINGKGGHGSAPQECVDPIHIAAHVITSIQTMIPRTLDAREPVVVSVCSINAGTAFNIIPDNVHFAGTVRTLSEERREEMPKKLESIIRGVTSTFGAEYDFSYINGVPAIINDPGVTELIKGVARELWGADAVVERDKPMMGSEDYSCYVEKVPGAMGFLGVKKAGAEVYPNHHPKFDFDERGLTYGVEFHVATVMKCLNGEI